ncbi:HNH endonuclease [Paenibacillus polymyxa]|uniref:HNH endonuclease n=1 Tax=Paenibacillus polymyxa TaxID=1406 RepID=UPI00338FB8AA
MVKIDFPIICNDTGEIFTTYKDYLGGRHWQNVRKRFAESKFKNECNVCKSKNKLNLHHKSYKRVGKERLNDLVYLCESCHNKAHELLKGEHSQKINLWNINRRMRKRKDNPRSKYSINNPRNMN